MNNAVVIVLLTWFLGNMGVHFITPELPFISQTLHASGHLSQMVISIFLLGKSLGVLVWGPMSERYGRRSFMLLGLAVYTVGALLSANSSSINQLLLFRFLQGLGVSATLIMGRSIVNDCYPEKSAIKAFAVIFTLAGVIISLLPLVGGTIASYFDWQISFYLMAAYAGFIFLLSSKLLPETNKQCTDSFTLRQIFADYNLVLHHPIFLAYLFISALMVAGESAFNTSASFILIKTHGVSQQYYGLIKTALGVAHLIGTALCASAIKYFNGKNLVAIGVTSFVLGSSLMVAFNFMNYPIATALVVPMLIYYFGTGFIVATTSSAIVRPFPKKMATAMAFCLFLQFIISSAFSFLASVLNIQTCLPLSLIIFSVSLMAFMIWYFVLYQHSDEGQVLTSNA